MRAKILGATVWTGVDGFGKRKRSTVQVEIFEVLLPLTHQDYETNEHQETWALD